MREQKINTFKLLAELPSDIEKFKALTTRKPFANWKITGALNMENNQVEFTTPYTLAKVLRLLGLVEDGHRMSQTVNHIEEYDVDAEWRDIY